MTFVQLLNVTQDHCWQTETHMTGSTFFGALTTDVAHILGIQGISLWRKFLLCILAIVAVTGYHVGKWTLYFKLTRKLTVRAQSGTRDLNQSREITVYPAKR